MRWPEQVLIDALVAAGIYREAAYGQVSRIWRYTLGDDQFRGIVIIDSLGAPVGSYGIYERFRPDDWPNGLSEIAADARIIRRSWDQTRPYEQIPVIGIKPYEQIEIPELAPQDRYGPNSAPATAAEAAAGRSWVGALDLAQFANKGQDIVAAAEYLHDNIATGA